jgi:anti-sigma regulatory factor (Ser/Thr protein kinase)
MDVLDQPDILFRRRITAAGLPRLRALVLRLASRCGLTTERAHQFIVAVSEAATNAITHGGRYRHAIIRQERDRLIVEIYDRGRSGLLPEPKLPSPRSTHGRGLYLAQALCDRMSIVTGKTGTTVRLEIAA